MTISNLLTRSLVGILLVSGFCHAAEPKKKRAAVPADSGEMVSVLVSNGDNDILYDRPPLDSQENIAALFDVLQSVYGVQRIYWRAGQIEQLIHHSKVRQENFTFHFLADYLLRLYDDPQINPTRTAVEIAHARKMQIWAWFALFDHGGEARVDAGKGTGPSPVEGNLRLEHPEWIPVDRHGIRRMSGGISLAYPEARSALVELYSQIAIENHYDGVTFHTYIEQFDARNEDEFAFNAPVVADYKKLHGVDIMTEPFDREKLAKLRGSYLTKFFRELRAVLAPHNIQIGLLLDPRRPNRPAPWLAAQIRKFSPAGAIEIDWEGLVDEGLVDELVSYFNGPNHALAAELYQKTKGTKTKAGVLSSGGYPEEFAWMKKAGVNRIMSGGYKDIEFGYFDPVKPEVMQGDDFIAKTTFLHQMERGQSPLNLDLLLGAVDDPHPWVRRRALAALVALKPEGPRVETSILKSLRDPITGVRSYATLAALQLGDGSKMDIIYDAVAERFDPPVTSAARSALQNLPTERTGDILQGMQHKDWHIRYLSALSLGNGARRPGAHPVLLAALEDPEAHVRWAATRALQALDPESQKALLDRLDDPDPTVRAMAAIRLAGMSGAQSRWIGDKQFAVFEALRDRFGRFAEDPERSDAAWGWVPLGESLLAMGPRGRAALEGFVADTTQPTRADHAWQILNVAHSNQTFLPVSFEEIDAAYSSHPKLRKDKPQAEKQSPSQQEPAMMPYLVQNFAVQGQELSKDGSLGQGRDLSGVWRGMAGRLRPNIKGRKQSLVRLETGPELMERAVTGTRTDYRPTDGNLDLKIQVTPEDLTGGLTIWITSSAQWSSTLKLLINPEGEVSLADADGRMRPTGYQVEAGQPVRFHVNADLSGALYSVAATRGTAESQKLAEDIPLKPGETYNQIAFLPGKEPGGIFLLEDVDWKVPNPAFAKSPK